MSEISREEGERTLIGRLEASVRFLTDWANRTPGSGQLMMLADLIKEAIAALREKNTQIHGLTVEAAKWHAEAGRLNAALRETQGNLRAFAGDVTTWVARYDVLRAEVAALRAQGQAAKQHDPRNEECCKSCSTRTWCQHFDRCLAESEPSDVGLSDWRMPLPAPPKEER